MSKHKLTVAEANAEVRRIRGQLGAAIRWTPTKTATIQALRRELINARASRLRARADALLDEL